MRYGLVVAAALLLEPTGVMAQNALRQACTADIRAFCGGVQPGEGRLRSCVREQFGHFSEPCKQALLSSVAVVRICKTDFQRTCPNVEPGSGSIQACMREHFTEYSQACREALLLAKLGTR